MNLSHLNLLIAILRFILPSGTVVVVRETSLVSENIKEYLFHRFGQSCTGSFTGALTTLYANLRQC